MEESDQNPSSCPQTRANGNLGLNLLPSACDAPPWSLGGGLGCGAGLKRIFFSVETFSPHIFPLKRQVPLVFWGADGLLHGYDIACFVHDTSTQHLKQTSIHLTQCGAFALAQDPVNHNLSTLFVGNSVPKTTDEKERLLSTLFFQSGQIAKEFSCQSAHLSRHSSLFITHCSCFVKLSFASHCRSRVGHQLRSWKGVRSSDCIRIP